MNYRTKTFMVAAVVTDETPHLELRFIKEPGGTWQPDIVVNMESKTVGPFPDCFRPTDELLTELNNAAWDDWKVSQLA